MAYNYETVDYKKQKKNLDLVSADRFLILACRAAYITGNRVGRMREEMEKNDTESAVQSGDDDQIYKVAV